MSSNASVPTMPAPMTSAPPVDRSELRRQLLASRRDFAATPAFQAAEHAVRAALPALLEQLEPDKLVPSSDEVPERFELGTLPYELLAGTTAAVDFLAGLDAGAVGTRRERLLKSMSALEVYEDELVEQLEDRLLALPGITMHGHAARRTPTLLFSLEGHDSPDVQRHLATVGVNAPAGSFYAIEASRHLGLGDTGAVRVGLAPYTDADDIDRLVAGLRTLVG
jgi:selenocysteine lyase/cysteine desulfurase